MISNLQLIFALLNESKAKPKDYMIYVKGEREREIHYRDPKKLTDLFENCYSGVIKDLHSDLKKFKSLDRHVVSAIWNFLNLNVDL